MINASDPDFRPLVQAALETGARYGELAHLEVRDFNPDAGTITIRIHPRHRPGAHQFVVGGNVMS